MSCHNDVMSRFGEARQQPRTCQIDFSAKPTSVLGVIDMKVICAVTGKSPRCLVAAVLGTKELQTVRVMTALSLAIFALAAETCFLKNNLHYKLVEQYETLKKYF